MSLLEQQVAQIRREMELLKKSQVVIYDTAPKEPTKQSIWREGSIVKVWDGKNWKATGGGISDFAMNVEFTANDYNTVSWSAGVLNVSKADTTATFSISPGSFDLTTNTYFYWQEDVPNAIQTTTDSFTAVASGGLLLATGYPNTDTSGKVVLNIFGGTGTDPFITAVNIANGAVETSKIAVSAITESLIAAGAITETKILDNSISSGKIMAGAIVAGKIAAGAIVAADIAAGTITATQIAASTITGAKIAAGTITASNIAASTITANEIAAGTITANKLSTSLLYAGSITLDTNGLIKGGQTAFNTGTGFFLGYSGAAYKFSIGDSSANYFTYDGSNMVVNGGTIRTGATGQRVELSGSSIRFYNSSNELRLQSNGSSFRFTNSGATYNTDIEGGNYSTLPALKVAGGIRADAIAGNLSTLNVFLHTGFLSFRDISNSLSGTVLSSPNDDTLVVQGTTITLNGKNLYSDGTNLYWNGVQIN